jgi:hypothetical protein
VLRKSRLLHLAVTLREPYEESVISEKVSVKLYMVWE